MTEPPQQVPPLVNEDAPEWAKNLIAKSNRAFRDEENAIYLLEMTCAPPGNPVVTELINALEGHFIIWNIRPKSHVVASSTEMKLSWLVPIGNNGVIPYIPELESKELKVTKVRDGVVPQAERDQNQDEAGYGTDHEAGAEAAADAGPAFQMDEMDAN
ncbi:hypothetical protein BST61_g1787 [Cercospora zeina]